MEALHWGGGRSPQTPVGLRGGGGLVVRYTDTDITTEFLLISVWEN